MAGAFRGFPGRERLTTAIASGLAALLLVGNLLVMQWIYEQVTGGLEARLRSLEGELLDPVPPGPPPKGRRP